MNYKQTRLEDVGWIYLAQSRDWWQTIADAVMDLWVLWSAKSLFSSGSPVRFSAATYFLAISFESNFQQRFSLCRARDFTYVKWLNFFSFTTIRHFCAHSKIKTPIQWPIPAVLRNLKMCADPAFGTNLAPDVNRFETIALHWVAIETLIVSSRATEVPYVKCRGKSQAMDVIVAIVPSINGLLKLKYTRGCW
jgi:hypothetical protein